MENKFASCLFAPLENCYQQSVWPGRQRGSLISRMSLISDDDRPTRVDRNHNSASRCRCMTVPNRGQEVICALDRTAPSSRHRFSNFDRTEWGKCGNAVSPYIGRTHTFQPRSAWRPMCSASRLSVLSGAVSLSQYPRCFVLTLSR